ncbi:MAG: type IV pilin protein [Pseudomonadota bacterium]
MNKPAMFGVTLIELLIVIAVVAIIATVAYPSYQDHVTQASRSEAHAVLLRAASEQEKYYLQNNQYGSMNEIGVSPLNTSDNYEFRVQRPNQKQNYILRAIARGSQADDTDCPIIYLGDDGDKTPADCW